MARLDSKVSAECRFGKYVKLFRAADVIHWSLDSVPLRNIQLGPCSPILLQVAYDIFGQRVYPVRYGRTVLVLHSRPLVVLFLLYLCELVR